MTHEATARAILTTLLIGFFAASSAVAGTIDLAWDAVPDPDLTGYRVYYGATTGNYANPVDIGTATEHTLTGMADCATWYVAVKAVNDSGLESNLFSNEISGWARPSITSAVPGSLEQGTQVAVTLSGANFQTDATVEASNPDVQIDGVAVNSCNQLVVTMTIGSSAALGAFDVDVINPDDVFGTASGLLSIGQAQIPPSITSQPAGQSVTEGQTATFSVSASGTAPLSYQWQKDGANIGGATASSYTTPAANLADDGTAYACVVSNPAGSATSSAAVLTVLDGTAPLITQLQASNVGQTEATLTWTTNELADSQVFYRQSGAPTYLQTPLDPALTTAHAVVLQGLQPGTTYEYRAQSADAAGNTATSTPDQTFTTDAQNGLPTASFSAAPTSGDIPVDVSFDGSGSSDPDGSIVSWDWDFGDGATASGSTASHTYTVAGAYVATLTVTDNDGAADSTTTTILASEPAVAPSITAQPSDATVTEGQTATFSVTASGTEPMSYQWQRDGANIPGATQSSHTTPATSLADDGAAFRCVVTNAAGTVTSNVAGLTVLDVTPPNITQVATSGVTETTATVTWTTDELSDSQTFYRTAGSSTYQQTSVDSTLTSSHSIGLSGLQPGTVYEYHVRSADLSGNAQLSTPDRTFTTSSPQNDPPTAAIAANPSSGEAPLTVSLDGSGSSDPDGSIVAYDWTFGDGGTATGATTSNTFADPGSYTVTLTVEDDQGALSSTTATIDVAEPTFPPTITQEPLDTTVPEGTTPTFDIVAEGTAPLSYQWQKNGSDISGATAPSYTAPRVAATDDLSTYRCVVTNPEGSGQSRSAVLGVNPSGQRVGSGAVVLYTFEEGSGETVEDLSGYGDPLDLTIADTRDVSWVQSGVLVDGRRGVLDSGTAATKIRDAVAATGEVSVEAWVEPLSASQSGPARIVGIETNGNARNVMLGQDGDSFEVNLRADGKSGGGEPAVATPSGIVTTAVQHVVFTRDDSGLERVFVNGVETASQIVGAGLSNWDDQYRLIVSNTPQANRPWSGVVNLVAIYDRALGLSEIDQNYAAGPYAQAPNRPPVVSLSATPVSGDAPLDVDFDASASVDPDGSIASFDWDFGDGSTGSGATPSHTYTSAGAYNATVSVVDDRGMSASAVIAIAVSEPPVAPTFTLQPSDATVTEGQTATFSVAAQGTAPLSFQWRKNGSNIPAATSPSYTTPPATLADHGAIFRCAVTNVAGSVVSAAGNLSVIDGTAPVLSQIQVSGVTQTGATVTWSTDEPATSEAYYRESGTSSFLTTSLDPTLTAAHSAQIQGLVAATTYEYIVESSDATGNTSSSTIATFTTASPPPNQPPSASLTANPTAGDAPVTVSFDGSGSSDPDGTIASYDWNFGDGSTGAGPTPAHVYTTEGTFTATLTVFDDDGDSDSASTTITVTLNEVVITTHPADQTVPEGGTATFVVVAGGSPPLTYQWRKNGANIAGATATSYTTPPVTLADDGAVYRCLVTNPAGSLTSQGGTLTVSDATGPVITQVQSSNVTSTTATIGWTTDEPATSEVVYRPVGDTTWQQSPLDSTLVASHTVQLQSLAASTDYEFHVRSIDGDGNLSTSSPNLTFTTGAIEGLPPAVQNLRRGDVRNSN